MRIAARRRLCRPSAAAVAVINSQSSNRRDSHAAALPLSTTIGARSCSETPSECTAATLSAEGWPCDGRPSAGGHAREGAGRERAGHGPSYGVRAGNGNIRCGAPCGSQATASCRFVWQANGTAEGWRCDGRPSAGDTCGSVRAATSGVGHRASALGRNPAPAHDLRRTGAAYDAPSQAVTHAITACDGRAAQGSERDVRPRGGRSGRDERRGGFVRRVGSHTATAHSLRCVRLARDGARAATLASHANGTRPEGWPCDDRPSAGEARRCGSRAGLPGGHRAALDRTRRRRTTNGRTGAAYHAPSQAVTHAITGCDGRAAQGGRVRIQAPLACHAAP